MKHFFLSCVFLSLILVSATVAGATSTAVDSVYPVRWYSGFTLPEYLAQPVGVKSRNDIATLLKQKWYADFQVRDTLDASTLTLDSCDDYFQAEQKPLEPVKASEYGPFRFMVTMCLASRAISEARPARVSRFSQLAFDTRLPTLLPVQMALIISSSERERILADKNMRYMSQVNRITRITRHRPYDVNYDHHGGSQQLQLVARGDFNHDGIEDYLISSQDSVRGGSYAAMRLFLVTRLPGQQDYSLLREYTK